MRHVRRRPSQAGVTLLDAVFVMSLLLVGTSVAVPVISEWQSRSRIQAAARLVAIQIRMARARAVRDGAHVGLVFRADERGVMFRMHRDGNANGLRRLDVDRGIDVPLGGPMRLGEWFAGTGFHIPLDLPPIDDGPGLAAGSDAIRLAGGGAILSCSPSGSATAGTLYVGNVRGDAFAVRVLGSTGRVRVLEYLRSAQGWQLRW
jgi:hypothetical protein